MSKTYTTVDQLIGKTPLVKLPESLVPENFNGNILLKLEEGLDPLVLTNILEIKLKFDIQYNIWGNLI